MTCEGTWREKNGGASGLWRECNEARGWFGDVEESRDVGDGLMGEGTCLVGHGRGKIWPLGLGLGGLSRPVLGLCKAWKHWASTGQWSSGPKDQTLFSWLRVGWARDRIGLNRSVPNLDTWAWGFGHLGTQVWPKENENILNK